MALWSTDYLVSLERVLARALQLKVEETRQMVWDLREGKRMSLQVESVAEANFLAENFLQLGAYVQVSQTGAFTVDRIFNEIVDSLGGDASGWMVLLDEEEERVRRIIHAGSMAYLVLEGQELRDRLGEELLLRGASPISKRDFRLLEERVAAWKAGWSSRIRNAIARKAALKNQG